MEITSSPGTGVCGRSDRGETPEVNEWIGKVLAAVAILDLGNAARER